MAIQSEALTPVGVFQEGCKLLIIMISNHTLWSVDISYATPPFLLNTHLESPAFATNSSMSRNTATTAVVPLK